MSESDSKTAEIPSQRSLFSNEALRYKCECEKCLSGEATTHNDASHDQSLEQWITFSHPTDESKSFKLYMMGGTTKCARVFAQYLFSLYVKDPKVFYQKKVLEVGSGTGLVGMVLARLGAYVVFTDQSCVMELLEANINENVFEMDRGRPTLKDEEHMRSGSSSDKKEDGSDKQEEEDDDWLPKYIPHTQAITLHWGDEEHIAEVWKSLEPYYTDDTTARTFDIVVGSDLIYAHENIAPLVATFSTFTRPNPPPTSRRTAEDFEDDAEEGKIELPKSVAYLAAIERFAWEKTFFEGMGAKLEKEVALEEGDIKVFAFARQTVAQRATATVVTTTEG